MFNNDQNILRGNVEKSRNLDINQKVDLSLNRIFSKKWTEVKYDNSWELTCFLNESRDTN